MTAPDWEVAALDPLQQRPAPLAGDTGACVTLLSAPASLPDGHDETPEFLSRAVFGTDQVLYLASSGPDAGCDRLVVDELSLDGGTVDVAARVQCDPGMAAQVVTYPASVVWVPDVEPDRVTASVTDGWDQSHAIETRTE